MDILNGEGVSVAMGRSRRNRKLVPECQPAIDQWKYEIAAELGLDVGPYAPQQYDTEFASELGVHSPAAPMSEDWGHITSRDAGVIGGNITARLIRKAQGTMV